MGLTAPEGRPLMKVVGLVVVGLLFVLPLKSQMNSESVEKKQQTPTIIVLPASKSLSPVQLEGKRTFLQRCSVCHLPGMASYSAYGPLLDGKIVASLGKAPVRDRIMHGSTGM